MNEPDMFSFINVPTRQNVEVGDLKKKLPTPYVSQYLKTKKGGEIHDLVLCNETQARSLSPRPTD